MDFWIRSVHYGLGSWLGMKSGFSEEYPHCRQLFVLSGDDYAAPLLEDEVYEPFPWDTTFPFNEHDFDGICEQMAWLNKETARFEQDD